MPYRKAKGRDTWHWCTNCSVWPKAKYVERPDKPPHGEGELCDQCKSKEARGDCMK